MPTATLLFPLLHRPGANICTRRWFTGTYHPRLTYLMLLSSPLSHTEEWRRSSLNNTQHIELIRGVSLAMMRYINRH